MQRLLMLTLFLMIPGCSSNSGGDDRNSTSLAETAAKPGAETTAGWDGRIERFGALRAMFHEGDTGSAVSLDTLLPSPDLYGVGALADLAGEVTIVAGQVYLARPDGNGTRTTKTRTTLAGATLLVAAHVPGWQVVVTDRLIPFEAIDGEIARLAAAAGVHTEDAFPFLVEGTCEDLQWHVIDGSKIDGGGRSHEDHLAAGIRTRLDRAQATLVGFYSPKDEGVFTHMGSRTHIHCALEAPLAAGHVEHVVIPAGTIMKFPRR